LDTYDFLADPRTLTLVERQSARDHYDHDHAAWQAKLQKLTEEPKPEDDFPAFLLATQPFVSLAKKLNKAESRNQLTAEAADELDWFVRAFADYLRTDQSVEIFPEAKHLAQPAAY
jgi:hypothetical protein